MATFIEIYEQIPEEYKTSMYYIIGSIESIKERIRNPNSIFDENTPTDFVDLPFDQQMLVKEFLHKRIEEIFFKRN